VAGDAADYAGAGEGMAEGGGGRGATWDAAASDATTDRKVSVPWLRREILTAAPSLLAAVLTYPSHAAAQYLCYPRTMATVFNVLNYGADPTGVADSSAAFQAAVDAADVDRITTNATRALVYVPAGTFLLADVRLRTKMTFYGLGTAETILVQKNLGERHYIIYITSDTTDIGDNLIDIVVKNLQLRGTCDTDGFLEHVHLFSVTGCTGLTITNVFFHGMRGDGLYLPRIDLNNFRRYNKDIFIRDCTFDGINYQNRQGITITSGEHIHITNCHFTRTSADNMPGAIDIEPAAVHDMILKNIRISGNTFDDIHGNSGAIILSLGYTPDIPFSDIIIENNIITLNRPPPALSHGITIINTQELGGWKEDGISGIVVRGNTVQAATPGSYAHPLIIGAVNDLLVENNTFIDSGYMAKISNTGIQAAYYHVHRLTMRGNTFIRCGQTALAGGYGVGMRVYNAYDCLFEKNTFIDCGNGGSTPYGIEFLDGTSSGIAFKGNTWKNTGISNNMTYAILKRIVNQTHAFTPSTNVFDAYNQIPAGMLNTFEWPGS
jgi:hypothetical protein